jgi:hypothetical protein
VHVAASFRHRLTARAELVGEQAAEHRATTRAATFATFAPIALLALRALGPLLVPWTGFVRAEAPRRHHHGALGAHAVALNRSADEHAAEQQVHGDGNHESDEQLLG